MEYDEVKLVCFEGKPHWLMPDSSFIPVRGSKNGFVTPGALYLKDRTMDALRLIRD